MPTRVRDTIRRVSKHELSELETGERVISERVPGQGWRIRVRYNDRCRPEQEGDEDAGIEMHRAAGSVAGDAGPEGE